MASHPVLLVLLYSWSLQQLVAGVAQGPTGPPGPTGYLALPGPTGDPGGTPGGTPGGGPPGPTTAVNECSDPSTNDCNLDPNNLATCVDLLNDYYCRCGYSEFGVIWDVATTTCVLPVGVTSVCNFDNGGCQHTCEAGSSFEAFTCGCRNGLSLSADMKTCEDIDECLATDACPETAECINTFGSNYCRCPTGFTHTNNLCVDVDECATSNGGCSHVCTNEVGTSICSCNTGYVLDSNRKSCTLMTCASHGTCEQVCTDSSLGPVCSCSTGFSLMDNQISCQDIDECTLGTADCQQVCTNTAGSYTCSCRRRYMGTNLGASLCQGPMDIHTDMSLEGAWHSALSDPGRPAALALAAELRPLIKNTVSISNKGITAIVILFREAVAGEQPLGTGSSIIAEIGVMTSVKVTDPVEEKELLAALSQSALGATVSVDGIPIVISKVVVAATASSSGSGDDVQTVLYMNCESFVDYCLNGGRCQRIDYQPTCVCTDGYKGDRCDETTGLTPEGLGLILLGVLTAVMFAIIATLGGCVWRNRNVYTYYRERYVTERVPKTEAPRPYRAAARAPAVQQQRPYERYTYDDDGMDDFDEYQGRENRGYDYMPVTARSESSQTFERDPYSRRLWMSPRDQRVIAPSAAASSQRSWWPY